MKKLFSILCLLVLGSYLLLHAQATGTTTDQLSVHYEELTAPDFIKSVEKSEGICLLPFGILEKHGPHLPLGTDLFGSRAVAERAALQEYCVMFPQYYFGQINEARNQPGTVSYSPELIWNMLQETCNELSRNGFKIIVIVNGHGGNNDFLNYFCMSQLHSQKDYTLVFFQPESDPSVDAKVKALRKTTTGGHADEEETSAMRVIRPDLVKTEMAGTQSGANQHRLSQIPYQYTGIWWYAQYPNHYAGDATQSSVELGKILLDSEASQLVKLIQVLKKDHSIETIQNLFYQDTKNPLNTKQ